MTAAQGNGNISSLYLLAWKNNILTVQCTHERCACDVRANVFMQTAKLLVSFTVLATVLAVCLF